MLGLLPDQTTTLVFADGRGVPRAVLGLTSADEANLVFADAQGESQIGMGLDSSGIGSVDDALGLHAEPLSRPTGSGRPKGSR